MVLRESQKKMIVGGGIALLMIMSTFGFILGYIADAPANLEYGEYEFKNINGNYKTEIDGKEQIFFLTPYDVEDIPIDEPTKTLFIADNYVVTYDPQQEHAQQMAEVQFMLEQSLGVERGLTNSTGTAVTQVNCSQSTSEKPVILLSQANETKVTSDGSCIKIEFMDDYDLSRQEELIRYRVLGVIQ